MISDGADRRHLHQGLAFGLANLAWAAGQALAAASSGALAQATVDAVPFAFWPWSSAPPPRPSFRPGADCWPGSACGHRRRPGSGRSGGRAGVTTGGPDPMRRGGGVLASVGVAGVVAAVVLSPHAARSAASQVWSPFVLVAGLLLVGLVAEEDGLFRVAGYRLARLAPNGVSLFAGAAVLVALVTAVLNLDTSVVFLTPVLAHAARSRGQEEAPLLYGCLLLSNAGSLLLPGIEPDQPDRGRPPPRLRGRLSSLVWRRRGSAPCVVTAAVVGVVERRSLRRWRRPGATASVQTSASAWWP